MFVVLLEPGQQIFYFNQRLHGNVGHEGEFSDVFKQLSHNFLFGAYIVGCVFWVVWFFVFELVCG